MRVPPWVILVGGLAAIAVLVVVAVLAAGGDDDDDDANAAAGDDTPTVSGDSFGPTPAMTEHILKVTPEHGDRIQQAQTIERPQGGTGVCAEVSYEGLPRNNVMFQMAVDGEIVTDRTVVTLIEGTPEDPKRGLLCYGTKGAPGIELGIHDAAVSVQDPDNLAARPSEVVGWKFEVIE